MAMEIYPAIYELFDLTFAEESYHTIPCNPNYNSALLNFKYNVPDLSVFKIIVV